MMSIQWVKNQRLSTTAMYVVWGVVFLIFALALYFPGLGKEYLLYGIETTDHDYIMQLFGWQSILKEGRLPIWNSYAFFGFPMIGSYALFPFYPSQWLNFILPFNSAFTMQYVLALTVGAICMMAWLRTLGFRIAIAGWSGLALMFSGHFLTLTYAGQLQEMITIAWAPGAWAATLVLIRRCIKDGKRCGGPSCLLALCLTMQLLVGNIQVFYATVLICLTHFVLMTIPLAIRAWRAPDPGLIAFSRTPEIMSIRAMCRWLCATLVILGLFSSIQMLHSMEILSASNNSWATLTHEETTDYSYPVLELAEYAVAGLWGDSVIEPTTLHAAGNSYTGTWGARYVSDFLGIPILLMCLFAFVSTRSFRYRLFLAMCLVISLLLALGYATPLHLLFYYLVPWFGAFASPRVWMFVSNYALLVLAAYGLEVILDYAKNWSYRPAEIPSARKDPQILTAIRLFITLITALGAAVFIIAWYRNFGVNLDIATYAEQMAYKRHAMFGKYGLQTALSGLLLNLALARYMPLHDLSARLRRYCSYTGIAFAVLALIVPLVINYHYIRFDYLDRYMELLNFQEYYKELSESKHLPLRMIDEHRQELRHMLHKVGVPEGKHTVQLNSYKKLLDTVGYNSARFGQLMAVTYTRTISGAEPEGGTWQPIYQKARENLWRWGGTQRPYVHNRANLVLASNDDGVNDILKNGGEKDFVVLADDAKMVGATNGVQPIMSSLVSWKSGSSVLKVKGMKQSGIGILPIAEPYAPGWIVKLNDGTQLKTLPVDGGLLGIALPSDMPEQNVYVEYSPRSLCFGIFITWMTLLSFIFLRSSRIAAWLRLRKFIR
ncbi:hypothetical protein GX645_04605 [Candidatus Sumerlaeota bacterium]|nr:hypothetical protein [Candidatus Sumerlaeota bacterium]